jgi:hypothetical protein
MQTMDASLEFFEAIHIKWLVDATVHSVTGEYDIRATDTKYSI